MPLQWPGNMFGYVQLSTRETPLGNPKDTHCRHGLRKVNQWDLFHLFLLSVEDSSLLACLPAQRIVNYTSIRPGAKQVVVTFSLGRRHKIGRSEPIVDHREFMLL